MPYRVTSLCDTEAVTHCWNTETFLQYSPPYDEGDKDCDDDDDDVESIVDVDYHLEDLPRKTKGKSIAKQGVRLVKAQLPNWW